MIAWKDDRVECPPLQDQGSVNVISHRCPKAEVLKKPPRQGFCRDAEEKLSPPRAWAPLLRPLRAFPVPAERVRARGRIVKTDALSTISRNQTFNSGRQSR